MTELKNPFTNAKVIGANTDPDAYHRPNAKRGDPQLSMSRSDLCEFARNPIRWRNGYRSEETDSTSWGGLIDSLLLEPADRFAKRYAITPRTYPAPKTHAKVKSGEIKEGDPLDWTGNATYCANWKAAQSGKEFVKEDDYERAKTARETVFEHESVEDVLFDADLQVMVVAEYHDKDTGILVPVKGLIDIVPSLSDTATGKMLIDFKTCTNAAMHVWEKSCFTYGYHVQAAMYLDLYTAATGDDRNTFAHIIQESFEPFHVEKRILSQEFVELGRHQYITALKQYCQCLKTGEWPGYPARTVINGWGLTEPAAWMLGV
jgi:exodeoxyribonuclease VIII